MNGFILEGANVAGLRIDAVRLAAAQAVVLIPV
jgi:hypothetical protein